MEKRIALIGIIVENLDSAKEVNDILHQYSEYIVGRMGLPHKEKDISIISIIMDADNDIISSVSGKIGMLPEVSCKTIYATK